ncbi:MAG: hypothetical protein NVS4B11_25460 [Ktedonobacteraceae bacterium]
MKTNTQNLTSKLQIVAIVLMTFGWGWSGGNFTPQGASIWNYLAHCIPLLVLLILSLQMFRMRDAQQPTEATISRARIGMSALVIVSIIGAIVLIMLGASNPDPNAVGVKTFADWFPTIILNMGNFLWLATLIPVRRARAQARLANNN